MGLAGATDAPFGGGDIFIIPISRDRRGGDD